jgi:multidrug efflux pump subunit AcrA (membrane-fusion protein)
MSSNFRPRSQKVTRIVSANVGDGADRNIAGTAPPPEALVAEVKQEDVPIYGDFVGTLDGSVNANIQARAQGYLTSQNYKEGGEVKQGDLLFQIDPHPFEAALAQPKAALAQAAAAAKIDEKINPLE